MWNLSKAQQPPLVTVFLVAIVFSLCFSTFQVKHSQQSWQVFIHTAATAGALNWSIKLTCSSCFYLSELPAIWVTTKTLWSFLTENKMCSDNKKTFFLGQRCFNLWLLPSLFFFPFFSNQLFLEYLCCLVGFVVVGVFLKLIIQTPHFFFLEKWFFYITSDVLLSWGIWKILNNLQLLGSFHAKAGFVLKPSLFSSSAFPSLGKNNLKVEWLACSGRDLKDKVTIYAVRTCAWAEQSDKCEHVMIFNPKAMQTLYTLNY